MDVCIVRYLILFAVFVIEMNLQMHNLENCLILIFQGLLSTWKKWTREEGPGGRISGSVCGLDPK